MITILYFIGKFFNWPLQWILFRKKVYYEDKKVTSRYIKGPALIVSNHTALMDFAMHVFLFPFHRLYCLMGELVYSHSKVLNVLLNLIGGVRVDRANYNFGFMDKSMKLFEKKKLLLVFPEAKVEQKGKMLPFHPSYILLALKSNTPIIPTYTDGKYRFKERCHVVIGKKINLRDYCTSENPTKEEIEYLNNLVKNKIKELSKLCKENENKQKYNQGFHLKYAFRDLGRFMAFTMNIHFKTKVMNKGKHKKNLKIKGGGIIVANHASFRDPLVLLNVFWRRRIYILTAEVVFDGHPFRSWLLHHLGCVRIDRRIADFDAIEKAINIIKAGNLLVVFPGGQIDRDGSIEEYKGGASLMAATANVPIYPCYLGKRTGKLGRSPVTLGEKIDVNTIRTSSRISTKDLDNISTRIYEEIEKLKELQNEHI